MYIWENNAEKCVCVLNEIFNNSMFLFFYYKDVFCFLKNLLMKLLCSINILS